MTQTPSKDTPQKATNPNFTLDGARVNSAPEGRRQVSESSLSPVLKHRTGIFRHFNNLSINRKTQLIPLLTFLALAGVVSVGAITLVGSLRNQLVNQARSQLAVAKTNYNQKFEEMERGLEKLAANPTIISALQARASNQTLDLSLQNQLREVLQRESRFGNLEYVTLVGLDLQIISDANQNRTGERFDPNNLVSQVLTAPLAIRSTEIASGSELTQESPSSDEVTQDALIRYVAVPIRSPDTGTSIGVLVAGDRVDRLSIVKNTVDAFADYGYSAIYQLEQSGDLSLVVSIEKQNPLEAQAFVPLDDRTLLTEAVATKGVVTKRMRLGERAYTVAAEPILNDAGDPVGAVVYGAPEETIQEIVKQSLRVQGGVAFAAIAVAVALSVLLGRAIANPIERLQTTAQKFSQGNYRVRAQSWTEDEIGQLGATFNVMADNIETNERQLLQETEQFRLLTDVTLSMSAADANRETIFERSLEQARILLQADRVVIYRFNPDWSGYISHEAVLPGWPQALNDQIKDPCIPQNLIEAYRNGRVVPTNNVFTTDYHPDHMQLLHRLKVQANLVVPILSQGKLFGILVAHHCASPHNWQEREIAFLKNLAGQLGVILDFAAILEQQKLSEEEQRSAKEKLQKRALELLKEVYPVSQGDLTVRAQVTEDEVGTIADFYNSTIESLRKLVTQVQTAAQQVAVTTNNNKQYILSLSDEATRQSEELKTALNRFEDMTQSIRAVSANAQEAEAFVQQAAQTVEQGDTAMNRTVEGFTVIRETVSETAQKVKNLGESSQRISQVVNLIGKFAAQTHLLALKASIEAARAGEGGQGFAAIADEVRSLAAQSAEATSDIDKLVSQIQVETDEVVAAMEAGTEQVAAGTELVEETRQSLNQITTVSTQINQLVEAIATAATEQAHTSDDVTKTMVDVAAIAQKTTTSATDVSTSFKELLRVAGELQEDVARFKVK